VSPSDAGSFCRALAERLATASVTVVHRPGASTIQGGEIAWVDAGPAGGLWVMPTASQLAGDEDSPLTLSVYPTTAVAIGAAVHAFLPGGKGQEPAAEAAQSGVTQRPI
jgi:hypothetical protein